MARKKKNKDEQLDLIDVTPKNKKAILKVAKDYKAALADRIEALNDEKAAKAKIIALVKETGLKPTEDGIIKFTIDGTTISITPRDKLVRVKTRDKAKEDEA